jgi:hypothetical protein
VLEDSGRAFYRQNHLPHGLGGILSNEVKAPWLDQRKANDS